MVIFGQTIQAFKKAPTSELLRFAKLLGVQCCELNVESVSYNNVGDILPLVQHLHVTFHLPVHEIEGYDFASPDETARIQEIINFLNDYGKALGIHFVVAHPPKRQGDLDALIRNLSRLDLPVVIENVVDYRMRAFKHLYSQLKERLGQQLHGWLYDVAHAYLQYGSPRFLKLLDVLPFNELQEIHLSDCTDTEDTHYPFGQGILPIHGILNELRQRNYKKLIVNEIHPYPTVWDLIDSYRTLAWYFNKKHYFNVTLRQILLKPFLQRKLDQVNLA